MASALLDCRLAASACPKRKLAKELPYDPKLGSFTLGTDVFRWLKLKVPPHATRHSLSSMIDLAAFDPDVKGVPALGPKPVIDDRNTQFAVDQVDQALTPGGRGVLTVELTSGKIMLSVTAGKLTFCRPLCCELIAPITDSPTVITRLGLKVLT